MKLVQVAEKNKRYYTKDFIHGFNTGAKTQLEADKKEMLRLGRWEKIELSAPSGDYVMFQCSECASLCQEPSSYCPKCGAGMREAKNECDDCFIPMFYNLEDDDSICRDCEVGE